jgi:3-carboxy-cis,cis-muconate cycloisomerase
MTTFGQLFVPEPLLHAVSDRAWLQAMLDAERALAAALAKAGVAPAGASRAIAEQCDVALYDVEGVVRDGRAAGNPAEPLVRALRERVGGDAATWVHWGATSQDVVDTASMLVARRSFELILPDLDRSLERLSDLAESHRSTPMAARTLLQQAVPTTFGFKAAGWLVALLEGRRALESARAELAAELGGAAGTLAPLGGQGVEVLRLFAEELGLAEPLLPWHTNRARVAKLGAALAIVSEALGKIGLDVVLLGQTEVGEVREASGGGSSTLPHKHNPVGATLARACARLAGAHAAILLGSTGHEHERAAGDWHAEWEALSGALAYTGGAAWATADCVGGLEVDPPRMRRNLDLTGGAILAERVAFSLAGALGRGEAHAVVRDAAAQAASGTGGTFADELRADGRTALTEEALAELLDPVTYLGSAEAFVDRALAEYRRGGGP